MLLSIVIVWRAVSALPSRPFTVGFAAETQRLEEHARAKLLAKNLDMIVANLVGAGIGFDCDDNSAVVLWRGGREALPSMSKARLAGEIIALIAARQRAVTDAARQPSAS